MNKHDESKIDLMIYSNSIIELEIFNCYELTEIDFYPPEDTRLYQSGIEDIEDGDNFEEYVEYFWDMYEDELYDN